MTAFDNVTLLPAPKCAAVEAANFERDCCRAFYSLRKPGGNVDVAMTG